MATTITPDIMEIISDLESFVSDEWELFTEYMVNKGFTEEDVEAMGDKLTEYLEEEGMR